MKRKTRVWLVVVAIVLLLAATCEAWVIYRPPPNSRRMMLAGHLTIDSQPLVVTEPERTHPILVLSGLYTPGLALLVFALLFRRQRIDATHSTV